jgi:hypothetical protein
MRVRAYPFQSAPTGFDVAVSQNPNERKRSLSWLAATPEAMQSG